MGQLSKKEHGRIKATLTQSRLGLFDTEEKMNNQNTNELVCEAMERCTPDIQKVLETFLCGTNTDAEYRKLIRNVDSQGVKNLAEICGKLEENPDILNDMSIRTIFGGTDHMPFRALVYLLPSLKMCEELKKNVHSKGYNPNIEFLFMNGAGIMANALDPEKADRTTAQFINVAKQYIDTFHQDLSENVNFYVDRTFTSKIMETQEYQKAHKILEEELGVKSWLKSDLLEMGKRRNAAKNSMKYATLHAFSQDGHIDSDISKMTNFFDGNEQPKSSVIVSIGARPEESFFKARKMLVSKLPKIEFFKPAQTVQYIANIDVPPYSPLPSGELYLDDVIKQPDLINKARLRDWSSKEFSDYQIPVQKAVESLVQDVNNSRSEKSLLEFLEDIKLKENDKFVEYR